MSDDGERLRVPGYVAQYDVPFFKLREDLSEADAAEIKARFLDSVGAHRPTIIADSGWTVESVDAAAQRAYAAFWGVLGPVGEQWDVMSDERKDCWRGVVRAVLGE